MPYQGLVAGTRPATTLLPRLHTSTDFIRCARFLKELAKRMGWTFEHERRTELDEAIDDLKAGHVHKAKDVDDLMAQLLMHPIDTGTHADLF